MGLVVIACSSYVDVQLQVWAYCQFFNLHCISQVCWFHACTSLPIPPAEGAESKGVMGALSLCVVTWWLAWLAGIVEF